MKKKILFIIDDMRIGGGAQRAVSLISKIISDKYEISILTFLNFKDHYSFIGAYYSLKENMGFLNKLLSSAKINALTRFFKIYKIVMKISPDIIISIRDFPNVITILTKIIFNIKIPLLISVRNNPNMAYKKYGLLYFLTNLLYKTNFVDKIITVSKEINFILVKEKKINTSKLKTIYNGIDITRINNLKDKEVKEYIDLFNNQNIVKFINIGRLKEQKGHRYLIEAFSKVNEKITDSKLIILGDGQLKGNLKTLIAQKNLTNDILLLGRKKNVYKYLNKSDIFVFSSIYEGFPNALLEALACGLPVISTNCSTGPLEIIKKNKYGLLVIPKDSNDLAEKMILLATNNEKRLHFSKLAFNRAKIFNIQNVYRNWIDVIEDLIGNRIY